MSETNKRYIRPFDINVFGKNFNDIFSSYEHLPEYVNDVSINIPVRRLLEFRRELEDIKDVEFYATDPFFFNTELSEDDNDFSTSIKKIIKSSLKIIFVVDATSERARESLFILIEFAKRYYVVFEVLLVLPFDFDESSNKYQYEIFLIMLKSALIKTKTIQFENDNEIRNKERILDEVLYCIQNY